MRRFANAARILAGLGLAGTLSTATGAAGTPPSIVGTSEGACGLVTELDPVAGGNGAYPIDIVEVDGAPRDPRHQAFPLSPGPHRFELAERIPVEELSVQVRHSRDQSIRRHAITIDVETDTVYRVGARLLRVQSSDPAAYWAPVIHQESGVPCSAKL